MKGRITNLMKTLINCKTTIPAVLTSALLACLALLPRNAFGVVPAPDGGYPGFNTAEGQKALFSLTTGGGNTAIGSFSLLSNTDGSFNTAVGSGTLLFNIGDQSNGYGVNNTAIGAAALLFNTTGYENTAVGTQALFSNTDGYENTATGYQALVSNTTGGANTATGDVALFSNTTGSANTASGVGALYSNTIGTGNSAFGVNALGSITSGNYNTATGLEALISSTTGASNTATGYQALFANTTGVENTAVGARSLDSSTGSYNVALAGGANLVTGDFNIYIGNDGESEESGTIRIGSYCCQSRAFISGISGVTVSGGATVYIKSDGQLGTSTSSARFKQDIRDMDKASETLLSLRPVTFHYKPELDPEGIAQFGLIAEEVEQVDPDLVVRDKDGKAFSVRYEQINAMLLNEFLKEHKKVEAQRVMIAELTRDSQMVSARQQKEIQILSAQLKEQSAQIQKVSAQVEMSKPTSKVVLNRR
jgi:trimeric autotransporter adhesin